MRMRAASFMRNRFPGVLFPKTTNNAIPAGWHARIHIRFAKLRMPFPALFRGFPARFFGKVRPSR
ncbi:hypothetical protein DSM101010T_02630 [Desulfovibrio subterraneus]|uniref:Uncharacterized protein n=1 Tax=Desulfovibrio subterraneus TaxID=2718620 RepID=A0A7J0BED6_9BACT|nr:hypothetical protein DSM101010T_02630 [Desulfovibrio subterraneus]